LREIYNKACETTENTAYKQPFIIEHCKLKVSLVTPFNHHCHRLHHL